eukprot:s1194_g7.t1
MTGVTLTTRSHPWVTSVLTSIVSTWDATLSFSTVTLTLNVAAHPHRDMFNHCDSRNMAMPLSRFIGGELFVESPDGLTQLSPDGPRGHTLDLSAPTSFPPRALHASLPWWGARLLLLAYHIGQSSRISEDFSVVITEIQRAHLMIEEDMQMIMKEIGKIQQHLNLDYLPLACEATPRSMLDSEDTVEDVRAVRKAVAFEDPLEVDVGDEDPTSDAPESPVGDLMTRAHVANKVRKLKRVREMSSQTEDSYRDTGCQTDTDFHKTSSFGLFWQNHGV